MDDQVKQIIKCRGCDSDSLESVLDFGEQWLPNFFKSRSEGEQLGRKAPLHIVVCTHCWLAQLAHTTPPDWLYRTFWYRSGITETMRGVLHGIVKDASSFVQLGEGDSVCDIGANDGTLLRFYPENVMRVGFEPAMNLKAVAEEGGNVILSDYFHAVSGLEEKFKIVTAIAMFYDLEDPLAFLHDVFEVMHPDGVFIIQMNYLATMLNECAFDNIGHEHLCYYSLNSLLPLLHRAGFQVVRVRLNDVNGGSVQVWCQKGLRRNVDNEDLATLLALESNMLLDSKDPYVAFSKRVNDLSHKIHMRLAQYDPSEVYALGASTRGSTLVQTLGLNYTKLMAAAERDERKIGLVTSGTWIPIISEEEARKHAKIFLVLPWHFRQEIQLRELDYLCGGGKLFFPLPEPTLVMYGTVNDVIGARL